MLLDNKHALAKNKAVTGSANAQTQLTNVMQLDPVKGYLINNASGNPVNLTAMFNDLGKADDMVLHFGVGSTQLAASSSACQLQLDLYAHTAAASIKSGSLIAGLTINGIAKAASIAAHCEAGKYLGAIKPPPGGWGDTTNYFVGVVAKVLTAKLLTGKINCWLGRAGDADTGLN